MKKLVQILENNYTEAEIKNFNNIYSIIELYIQEADNKRILKKSLNKGIDTAIILAQVHMDIDSLLAGLCLDFVRTDNLTAKQMELKKSIVKLIDGTLKIEEIVYKDKQENIDILRAMFVAMAKDIRTLIIKLSDVLQLARNPRGIEERVLEHVHKEIKEIYAPLAARLGLNFIKSHLQDENFKYLNPEEHYELQGEVLIQGKKRRVLLSKNIKKIRRMLANLQVNSKVYGRVKHISSVHKKLMATGKGLDEIYDLTAIRVITKNVNECYAVLGGLHSIYSPMGHRFKDMIAKPKANGYQSLHTTLENVDGDVFEVQIRTETMHTQAEYGVAAHWLYKEDKSKKNNVDLKLNWMRQVIENKAEESAIEILSNLQDEVNEDEIYVQTPKGKIVELPFNSTPIDFAYHIHSEVGNKCVGAKVNGKMVPLSTSLNNGETVDIITAKTSKGPSRDWLKIAKSASARSKINSFFKKERKDENIKRGKSMLEQAAKAKNVKLHKLMDNKWMDELYERYSLTGLDDMYASIGHNSLTAGQILTKLTRLYEEYTAPEKQEIFIEPKNTSPKKQVKGDTIIVKGLNNILTKFAKCCTPVPGDEITAYITRGKGATIHRATCKSLHHLGTERLLEANWGNIENASYIAELNIIVSNISGSLAGISNKIAELNLNIASLTANKITNDRTLVNIIVIINKEGQLAELIKKLGHVKDVYEVYRTSDN
jgi:GTP pyrophosphokinase